MTMQNYRKSLLAASCLAGLLATPAFAQEPPEPGDTVIVTGHTYNELATSSATKNDAPQLETPPFKVNPRATSKSQPTVL